MFLKADLHPLSWRDLLLVSAVVLVDGLHLVQALKHLVDVGVLLRQERQALKRFKIRVAKNMSGLRNIQCHGSNLLSEGAM